MHEDIRRLADRIKGADRVCVLTGAGVSAESGVPTFRGPQGMWKNHDPTELATPQAFSRDPKLVWEFYNWRRTLLSEVQCNPAHTALAAMESLVPHFTLVTQNVDGLHRKAGSANIIEIHGNIWNVRCTSCGHERQDPSPNLGELPCCDVCGGLLRPGVVWFNESLDPELWRQSVEAASRAEVMLVAGTSAVVQPAASLAGVAKRFGALVAEINPEATDQSDMMDIALRGKAGEVLPKLLED